MSELLLVAAAVTAIYLVSCGVWPYRRCDWCAAGKHAREDGVVWRKCWRCAGSGKRRRAGAWLLNRGG